MNRVERMFAAAIRLDAEARRRFVALCGEREPALLPEIESLLAAHEQAETPSARGTSFLEAPARADHPERPDPLPPQLGVGAKYRVRSVIGSGGMGSVYHAEQIEPVHRDVALKVLRRELETPEARARFAAEQRVVARMDHENVARLFDAGTADDGRPYFAMELVAGVALNHWCEALSLPLRERIALFVPVCRAVHHAHQKGVVHRDLKPSNVLVTLKDGRAVPKVIDFGVAKAAAPPRTSDGDGGAAFSTERGELLGTLEYMSPEQAGAAADVDTRADLYSLGVMLYELVAGRLPFEAKELREHGLAEALRIVREVEPPRPSSRVEPSARRSLLELDWVVLKAMEKERSARYASAAELADELERFLAHEPLSVAPPTARYRFAKLVRRHRGAFAAILAVVASLATGLGAAVWQSIEANRERDAALAATREARLNLAAALSVTGSMQTFVGETLANVAGGTAARLMLVRRLLDSSLQLQNLAGEDLGVSYTLAYAYQRLGEAQLIAGQSAAALESHLASLRVRQETVEREGSDNRHVRSLGVGHWKVSEALTALGRTQEALRHDEEALSIHRRLVGVDVSPIVVDPVYLGISLRRVGDLERQLGSLEQALRHFHESLQTIDTGIQIDPKHPILLVNRGATLRGLGETCTAAGDFLVAEESLRASVDQLSAASKRAGPTNLFERMALARTHVSLAELFLSQARHDEAVAEAELAIGPCETIAAIDPPFVEARQVLARARMIAANALHASGRSAEAAKNADLAVLLLAELAAQDPANALVAQDLAAARGISRR